MGLYHIYNNVVVECDGDSCNIGDQSHYDNYVDAIIELGNDFHLEVSDYFPCQLSISKYNSNINYNSGMTAHYVNHRIPREQELTRLLGLGKRVALFVVIDKGSKRIQEIRDNGVVHVYDYDTHEKITLFAPHPNRINNLFEAVGEIPPDSLLDKSSKNYELGYNDIYNQ